MGCATDGVAGAGLLRAAVIGGGAETARHRRGDRVSAPGLARGPGNLCSALGITMGDNGTDLFDANAEVRLELGEGQAGVLGPRVGVSKAADRPWRRRKAAIAASWRARLRVSRSTPRCRRKASPYSVTAHSCSPACRQAGSTSSPRSLRGNDETVVHAAAPTQSGRQAPSDPS